jgi:hypothetical protein
VSRIAIIGAGIGGLVLANRVSGNHEVTILEKGRGVGGRMASRYAGAFMFDHGAQYFTARDERFVRLLQPLLASGAVAEWKGQTAKIDGARRIELRHPKETWHVGAPNMNSMAKALAAGLDVRTGVDVAPLDSMAADGWHLRDIAGNDLGAFDWVISTTTPHHTMALFAKYAPADGPLTTSRMLPCYALMLGFEHKLVLPWISARVDNSAIDWIGVNSSKPGRDDGVTTLVVHSTSQWGAAHLDQPAEVLQQQLEQALAEATDISPMHASFRALHRWRSARLDGEQQAAPFFDAQNGIGATGDWAKGSRVENAVVSALELADRLL